jgi:DNA gyrase subunit A
MDDTGERIRDIPIEEDMKDAYLRYAMSVIISRALPDVRDGLKPSQRRILVAMNDLNLGPRSGHRKCAKIAGDTSGNYHPHGQEVVYPTLVRMGQTFTCRYPLVDAQGNFGSADGDPPAAMRYTEARLSSVATEMLADIQYDTVDFVPNYDETRTEPTVLPGKFPNLLCNGGNGIAVGMATSIPPHNLTEVVNGIVHLLDHPECTVDDLMEHVPGPDFPGGGVIAGRTGIIQGYRTGRGIVYVRGKTTVEESTRGRERIVITEIPYQVTRTAIKERIAAAVNSGQIPGISDMRDESGSRGQRLVVELKRGEDPQIVLNHLYQHTPLQTSVSLIMIALVDNRPRTLNLKDMMACFIDHRVQVIRRRTQFLLDRAQERAHIIEGLRIALAHIDEIIALIKKAPDVQAAHDQLRERYDLSERQANAILDMRLQRLTGLERHKLEEEYRELLDKIADYEAILASKERVRQIIKDDLLELQRRFGDDRRTLITDEELCIDQEDLIADEPMAVTLSHEGYIKRMPLDTYRAQGRGGKGITGASTKEGDFVEHLFIASTHDTLLFFTSVGKVHWLKVYQIPQLGRTSRGRAISNLLSLQQGETIASLLAVREFDPDFHVLFATADGIVKKTTLDAFSHPRAGGIIAVGLADGDRLIGARLTNGTNDILLGTHHGMAIRFSEDDVRPMGRTARGVKGIKLRDGDHVVGMTVVDEDATLLSVCEHGYGKRTAFGEYSRQRRGGLGLIDIKTTQRNGNVIGLMTVSEDDEVMFITANGKVVRTAMAQTRPIGRNTQGVTLVTCNDGDRVVAIARVVETEEDEDDDESDAETADADETAAAPADEDE